MLTLDYRLDPGAAAKTRGVDMATADAASIRYQLFPGDIILRGEGADFSTHWGWVQVLDFALSLPVISETLRRDGAARFEFTESSAALDFRLEGDDVVISSSYTPGLLRVRYQELVNQVRRLAQLVVRDLCEQHPRLAMNPGVKLANP